MNPRELGARLAAARHAAHYTQRDVQRNTGIDQATISRMEHGTQEPTALEVWRLAALYGISVDLLLPITSDGMARRVPGEVVRVGLLNEDSNHRAGVQL